MERSLVNEADSRAWENPEQRLRLSVEPGVNAGPSTGCAGNGREGP